MRRQISVTYLAMQNAIFRPTRRSRNRPKPIPTASQIVTFDYIGGIRARVDDKMRMPR
ncbi:NinE family protein [Paramixta manurensis]|uniref:NinE family protein n=1 Tax=Paramixta manurensis TaxID=2740817 RepID=A0A6M8UE38_9GAMM|nr:NinE family protein [Erwiniaceae bacterium PD-1]